MAARRLTLGIAIAAGVVLAGAGLVATAQTSAPTVHAAETAPPATPSSTPSPTPAAGPAADPQAETGRYLVTVGDCEGCHNRPGGPALAGGVPLNTPFGVIYSSNITPDRDTGIGAWSADDFWNAMHRGVRRDGAKLYPAFPYTYFTHIDRAQSDAIYAYLKTVPAVRYTPPGNKLPFPLNIRFMVTFWDWLFFKVDDHALAGQDRGAQFVQGLGHCGACHTPTNLLGGTEASKAFQGGKLDNWFAPELNADPRRGLGAWSQADVVEFLKTGRNGRANVSASMGEVVTYSTSHMRDDDLAAMAAYLKAQPAPSGSTPSAPDAKRLAAGQAIYVDQCAACHTADGSGKPLYFPPLKGAALTQSKDPTTVIRFILSGTQTTPTDARPTPLSMPAYDWKLSDQQVADVATYVRNAWGNQAPVVSAGDVGRLRRKVGQPVRKPSATV